MIRKSTYILLIILIILAAVVIFLQRTPGMKSGSFNQPTSTESPILFNWGDKSIAAVTMSDDQGHVFKANLDNQNNWFIEQPTGCQLENGKVENYLVQLQTFRIMVEMEAPPALADVGLTNPTYTLKLTFIDGSMQTLSVGSVVPTGSGYYVQVNKDPVVVVTKNSIDSLFELVSTACATPTVEVNPTSTLELILTEPVTNAITPVP
ncbi:MAG: DUF4340 domain-containing protein [Anaerolineaceae bacterium]